MVTTYRKGEHGQTIVEKKNAASIERLYEDMGRYLASDIHVITYQPGSTNLANPGTGQVDFVPKHLLVLAQQRMKLLQEHQKEWVLTHGDFGIHNVLYTDDHQLTVLDWEWASWAHPLTDVSWVCWFTAFHYPKQAPRWNQTFLQAYQQHRTLRITENTLQAYAVANVWKILQKVQQAPRHVQQEWVRRLEWTLAHSFSYD
ncbi:phosphotransferase family protein [Marinococcus sp. PL1-022]|uniref:phosphotransferase family protein n=1 Tax=Marinococcus sp. PL1-022 TaxID=3095363 RepID=UPI0029C1069E|nr:phosphotransferase [Marinococcus sp. PL1-022]MDX6153103.1 phosphotransferase [Marinococcus sp. PL1-022]